MTHAKGIGTGKGKNAKWAVRPSPGPHPWRKSITLVTVLRDILGHADNGREAKKIVKDGLVLVDGVVERNHKRGVGLMDVLELPKIKKAYRVIPTSKGLQLTEADSKESKIKLCKITGKRTITKGGTQLSFHDGTTLIDGKKEFNVNDTAVISLPERKIKKRVEFREGASALVVSGRHSGDQGKITKILPAIASRKSLTTLRELETLTDYVFAVGESKPEVKLG